MGDDATACRINDLPKVTAILSSESISKTQAFDMMVRFLRGRPPEQQDHHHHNYDTTDTPVLGRPVPVRHHHYWQDLYHVTETLVDHSTTQDQQQRQGQLETLRTLRLTVAMTTLPDTKLPDDHHHHHHHHHHPTKMEDSTEQVQNHHTDQVLIVVKKEDISPNEPDHHHDNDNDDDDEPNRNHNTKKDRKEKKKKNKKRHRESKDSCEGQ